MDKSVEPIDQIGANAQIEPIRQPLLQVEALKKYYPIRSGLFLKQKAFVKALDGFSLSIYPGETVGLVGESGCGKSTAGKLIVRLEDPTEGTIRFEGQDITSLAGSKMRSIRQRLQIVFQDPYSSLNPRQRIGSLLAEPLIVHGMERAAANVRAEELLELVGLSKAHKHRFPHEFSGGQRQRIGVARAISLNPKLIVCDEPVSALDASIQAQILNLLKDLQNQFQFSYLFIAHGLGAVRYISDRIAVMYLGKIVEIAKTETLFRAPRHPYTRALLDAYPVPDPKQRGKERVVLEGEVPSSVNPPSGCRFRTRCPFAQPVCSELEPELAGSGDHVAACHFPLQ
ncbi:ABC transporter ATP-binding protein [Paenibacillus oceani]|uniref:ATP-binding cassette domain-containing protein n=1 Tax=Paenibacillus oceani TaxID=2772510 RepID=A0A927CHN4_9BACL|nr:oligopeptide/dipeptide ABC transporter ATP-binding protein [Paenibacillus oceani]MBD2866111.1 ATP-binding cassette domain-containing protein [Paenibacillus oceani]